MHSNTCALIYIEWSIGHDLLGIPIPCCDVAEQEYCTAGADVFGTEMTPWTSEHENTPIQYGNVFVDGFQGTPLFPTDSSPFVFEENTFSIPCNRGSNATVLGETEAADW